MDKKDNDQIANKTDNEQEMDKKATEQAPDTKGTGQVMDKKDVVYGKIPKSKMMFVHEAARSGYKALRRFTYEDYCTWPDDERWELIDGVPFKMEAPSEYHQQISGNLFFALRGYLTGKTCKAYHAPFDVRLHIDGIKDTVVQPDILVICDLDILDYKGAKGSPDLVIEILSPSNAKKDQVLKLAKYEKHGVKEVWIIDPIKLTVSVYILNKSGRYNNPAIYQNRDDYLEATVLLDFKISLANIFTKENVANNELREEGVQQGIRQGIQQEKLALEKNAEMALRNGISIDVIMQLTNLSEDTILRLKDQIYS